MGADCIISGIRPQIAQTIVHLGIDLFVGRHQGQPVRRLRPGTEAPRTGGGTRHVRRARNQGLWTASRFCVWAIVCWSPSRSTCTMSWR